MPEAPISSHRRPAALETIVERVVFMFQALVVEEIRVTQTSWERRNEEEAHNSCSICTFPKTISALHFRHSSHRPRFLFFVCVKIGVSGRQVGGSCTCAVSLKWPHIVLDIVPVAPPIVLHVVIARKYLLSRVLHRSGRVGPLFFCFCLFSMFFNPYQEKLMLDRRLLVWL